jgi:UDP-3-O-[3-hydroxymyristoyl] glucosamine N-acyltransferase
MARADSLASMSSPPLRLAEVIARCGGELIGDPDLVVRRIATLKSAGPGDLSFLTDHRRRAEAATTQATAVIVAETERDATARPRIVCRDPYAYLARASTLFDSPVAAKPGIHATAIVAQGANVAQSASIGPGCVIEQAARIGASVVLGAHCFVGEEVTIGEASRLYPRVTIYPRCSIGARAIIHSGVVIGADGFGFAPESGKWLKIHQTGRVVIGDDVEIGANTTIDRGALDDTVLEDGVKLDNQIQIGHNCRIGAHTAVAGCTGIAGSTTIGRHCMIGGAAMIAGHIDIADHVVVAAASGVSKSITEPGVYSSALPSIGVREWRRSLAHIRGLERTSQRIRELERRLGKMEQDR